MKYLSRSSKRNTLLTYESSIPNTIADKDVILPPDLDATLSDLMMNISRFDLLQSQKGYSFPTVLLRSESAASSQIEHLTSSISNIALAEISSKSPHKSRITNYMQDLIAYANRIDVNPIVKAAILHAQFETIHPFVEGNGRTGRV